MICCPETFSPWSAVALRTATTAAEANARTAIETGMDADPAIDEIRQADHMDAFLSDSAHALGIDRSRLEREAAAGLIEWRQENFRPYEVRRAGETFTLRYRRQGNQDFNEWEKFIKSLQS